jgi:hypothetical protein
MYLAKKEARILAPRSTIWGDDLTQVKQPHEDERGYVYLQHGDVYRICLRNHSDENNDVIVEVDGKEIGCWRLKAFQTAIIERSVDDLGQFTFYEIDSSEAQKIGLKAIARTDLGLVKVTFIPEKPRHSGIPTSDIFHPSAKSNGTINCSDWSKNSSSGSRGSGQSVNLNMHSAGGTGLSGRSEQRFGLAGAIDRDYENQVIINLRLISKPSNEPRPLQAVNSTVSNLVPPPVN